MTKTFVTEIADFFVHVRKLFENLHQIASDNLMVKRHFFVPVGDPLKLMQVHIPEHTIHNTSVSLHCRYDLEGAALYSVKWYKDGVEFYRYILEEQPPAQIFNVPGIFIDVSIMRYFEEHPR